MWNIARKLGDSEIAQVSTMHALLNTTTRNLLVLSGVVWLVCALVFTSTLPGERIGVLMAGILLVGLIFGMAYQLVPRQSLSALVLWLVGMLTAILLGCWLLQNPGLALLGSVLPLLAVLAVSGWAGLVVQGCVIALVWLLTQPLLAPPLPPDQAVVIVVCAAFSALLGWVARAELSTVAEWSLNSFLAERKHLGEMREQRLELEQSREDLILANRELARLTERLKALERIADEARQAKTDFVANVSHELRTPLNMIIGFADVISQSPQLYGGHLPAALLTDIAAIRRNAEHLAALVNDVLDLSQVEAGRMALRREWVAVEPMIQESLSVVKGLFESRRLYLKSEIGADAKGAPLPQLSCDATRIRQVIINLLGNAARFTESGGVLLRCVEIDHSLVISVADTGPGIAPQDQQRIFEPFQQVDVSTRRKHGGSGLGLTISKQFVEMHGGKMWLESEVGVGTTIYFSLPLSVPSALPMSSLNQLQRSLTPDDEVGYRTQRRRSLAPHPSLTERFVVVDAEGTVQRLFDRYLPNIEVESATDAHDALAALQRSPAQGLIVNQSHFDHTSAAVLADLPFGTPIFCFWLPGEQEAARRLGVVEYLIKPISSKQLHAALNRLGAPIKTVLIVDDDEDELHLFARMLATEDHRYAVLQVTSGQRALNMLRHRRPDVVLLDLMMPGMNGFQVLEEKARDPAIAAIPVLIISSLDTAVDPVVDSITIRHGTGIAQRDLIACIHSLGAILTPSMHVEVADSGAES